MSDPIFLKSGHSDLYFLPGASQETSLDGYQCAFLPPDGKLPTSPLSLSASWEIPGGMYIFLNDMPADEPAFAASVRKFYASSTRQARFFWLDDPNVPASGWSPQYIEADGAGQLTKLAQLRFRNYRLVIGANAQVSLQGPDVPAGFAIRQPPGVARWCYWQTGSGSALYVPEPSIALPITGSALGCMAFPLQLAQQTADDWDALDAGIRYYYDHPDYPGYLQSLRYRVFNAAGQTIRLDASIDPINPLLAARSGFAFANDDGGTAPVLHTHYATWTGQPVQVQPMPGGDAKLVFAVQPSAQTETDADPYTLVPSGIYEVHGESPDSAGEVTVPVPNQARFRLMLGTSALEYAGSIAATGNRLHFVPGQPAYAPRFAAGNSEAGEGLQGNALTSYLYVSSQEDDAVAYYTQPEKSVLYQLADASSATNPVTDYMELAVKPLPGSRMAQLAFPAVPYGNLHGLPNADQYAAFEKQVLAPARQARIMQAADPDMLTTSADERQETARLAVTRKGWLAKFSQDASMWQSLVLAQAQQGNEALELAGPDGGPISGPLKEALQSNQLFLVAEGPKFAQHAALLSAMLTMEGFSFDLNPAKWAAAGTIMIFKYGTGTLKELAAKLEAWTMADAFNEGALTQLHMLRIFQNAEEMAKTHAEFQAFADLLANPGWTGLLALNVHTPLEDLPPELAGLRGGIEAADFKAHHLGIHSSPVLVEDEGNMVPIIIQNGEGSASGQDDQLRGAPATIRLKDSSMFGLIYYDDEAPMRQDGSVYRYRVKTLKVLFENAAIKSFSSSVELLLNQLFGDQVELQGGAGGPNVIPFNGVYQDLGGRKTYVFLNGQDLHFRVKSEVLEEVELIRAQFMTETTETEQQAGQDIDSRFAFWGNLRFRHRPEFDLFSFGNGPDGEAGQLNFSGLALHMRFPQANPDNKQFVFDAGSLSFNLAASRAREESLFRHFPLKLAGFIQAEEGSSPTSLGYHSVQTPISESSLLYPWYGLEFELNLGSLGALASQAGFTAKLLAAWSPGTGGISMFTGMYIPGTGDSGKMFALENILRFSIDAFRLETGTAVSGHTSYTLILNNLRLNFLGMQFPPSAYVDFVLFGNPDPSARADSLGWFASYTDENAISKT